MLIYSIMRSTVLETSDLRHNYLNPTRGVLYLGKDIYKDYAFNSFSPFFYCVMGFFAQFTNGFAAFLWYLCNASMYLGINALIIAIIKRTQFNKKKYSVFIAPLLTIVILADNLYLGQSNIFTFFFVCLALYCYLTKRDLHSGFFLSIAIAFKITPALFLFHFLLKRRWKAIFGTAIGLTVCLLIIPSFYFGVKKNVYYAKTWTKTIISPFVTGKNIRSTNVTWYHTNQSLEASLNRHLTSYGRREYGGLHEIIDPAFMTEQQVHKLAIGIKLLILGLIAFVTLKYRKSLYRPFPFEMSLIFMGMFYLSPVAWISHYMVILFPYAVAVNELIEHEKGDIGRKVLAVSLWTAMIFSCFSLTPYLQSFSFLFIGNVFFFIGFSVFSLFFLRSKTASSA
jgi:hypothetical protein